MGWRSKRRHVLKELARTHAPLGYCRCREAFGGGVGRQLGVTFRRQFAIDRYIVDCIAWTKTWSI
jgi:hypothetical protein